MSEGDKERGERERREREVGGKLKNHLTI